MNNNNNKFDKELHDRLSTEELPFDPMAWDMMEERLDEEPKRGFLLWILSNKYLIGSLSILLLATLSYWSYHYSNSADIGHSEVAPISDTKSNLTTDINATSEFNINSTNESNEKSLTVVQEKLNQDIKLSPTSPSSTKKKLATEKKVIYYKQ